jgi:hypothetical protein
VDLAVRADLSVLSGTSIPDARSVPMDPVLGNGLAHDPSVAAVFRPRLRNVDVEDLVTKIQAIEMAAALPGQRGAGAVIMATPRMD